MGPLKAELQELAAFGLSVWALSSQAQVTWIQQ